MIIINNDSLSEPKHAHTRSRPANESSQVSNRITMYFYTTIIMLSPPNKTTTARAIRGVFGEVKDEWIAIVARASENPTSVLSPAAIPRHNNGRRLLLLRFIATDIGTYNNEMLL